MSNDKLIQTYASNLTKILYHTGHLNDVKRKGIIRPITIDVNPSGYCNGKCSFCTQTNIDKVFIKYEPLMKALKLYKQAGAESIEWTGGGEPTLHPRINNMILESKSLGYEMGMITNGLLLDEKLSTEAMQSLTWLRVSLNPSYDMNKEVPTKPVLEDYVGTYGANFVWCDEHDENTLDWILNAYKLGGFKYVKLTPNVLSSNVNTLLKKVENYLINIDLPIFVGGRTTFNDVSIPESCFSGFLKPHIDQNGKVYRCSCASWEEKRYPDYAILSDIYDPNFSVPLTPDNFDTSQCSVCHYQDLNGLVKMLLGDLEHNEFI